jgi:membrane dipeptidase
VDAAPPPIVDAHADVFSKAVEEGLDYLDDAPRFQASLARLCEGGVTLQWASIYVPATFAGQDATEEALKIAALAADVARRRGAAGAPVLGRADVEAVRRLRPGVDEPRFLLAMEGASPLCGDVDRLDDFVERGLRVLGLTHNHDNECGDGCFAKAPRGLTEVGRVLAREAEARGVLLDAAHLNPRAFDDLLSVARGPVAYTHGGSRALVDAPRNLTDDQARALAATGGVLGVDFFPGHVARDRKSGALTDAVDHVDHWIRLVGPDHVGFGGDFDGIPSTLKGVEDARAYPRILAALAARGHDAATLSKVAGENWLRVLARTLH